MPVERPPDHVALFSETSTFLADRIATFVSEGLVAGEHVIVMATLAHWNAVAARLEHHNLAYGRALAQGRLVLLDADEILDGITVDGQASPDRFGAAIRPLIKHDVVQRIYGEVVALLAQRGDLEVALAIESLGHELAQAHGVRVLCGYHLDGTGRFPAAALARLEAAHHRSHFEGRCAPAAGEPHITVDASPEPAPPFYEDRESPGRIVADFVAAGFLAGSPAIVIATPDHRDAIRHVLSAHYFEVGRMESAGDLIMVDVQQILSQVMRDGMPDALLFRQTLVPLLEQACRGRRDCVIRVYGEMVAVLEEAGEPAAAIGVEALWNQLAQAHSFGLLLGHPMMAQVGVRS
jgi:hypothetical protein